MFRSAVLPAVLLAVDAFAQEPSPRPRGPVAFVMPSGGDLTLDGSNARFWGIALRSTPPEFAVPADKDAPAKTLASRFAVAGANLLRVEIPSPDDPSAEVNMEAIDSLLGFSRDTGTRLWLGATAALGSATPDSVGILDDPASAEEWSAAVDAMPEHRIWLNGALDCAWDPRLELLAIQHLRDRAQHFNETTGLRWADDPAIVLWELDGADDWHGRMAAGWSASLPEISLRFLDMQRRAWMLDRFPPDVLPDALAPEQEQEFRNDLWTAHKRRISDQFRLWGQSTRRSPVAWREIAFPNIRPDDSGCSILYARLQDLADPTFNADWRKRLATDGTTISALRLWIGATELVEKPDAPWSVLAAAGGIDYLVWDGFLPTNAIPLAFHAAFAAAGDLFRTGFSGGAFAPALGHDHSECHIRTKAATWDRAPASTSAPILLGGSEFLRVSPVRDGEPLQTAVALLRHVPNRRTAYIATDLKVPIVLEILPDAAKADGFWKSPSLVFDAVDISSAALLHERTEELPVRIELPRGTFRLDIVEK